MRALTITIALLMGAICMNGQLYSTNWGSIPSQINPASLGSDNEKTIYLSHQSYSFANFDAAPTRSQLGIDAAMGRSVGIGFQIAHERFGPTSNTELKMGYAYQLMSKKDKFQLSFGLAGRLGFERIDPHQIKFGEIETTGSQVGGTDVNPNFDIGLNLRYGNLNAGLGWLNIVQDSELSDLENPVRAESDIIAAHASYDHNINSDILIRPTAYFSIDASGANVEIGGLAMYKQIISLQSNFRTGDALFFGAGAHFDQLSLNFNYGIAMSDVRSYGGGNISEFMIRYRLKGKENITVSE